jgi:hypothetical protein
MTKVDMLIKHRPKFSMYTKCITDKIGLELEERRFVGLKHFSFYIASINTFEIKRERALMKHAYTHTRLRLEEHKQALTTRPHALSLLIFVAPLAGAKC